MSTNYHHGVRATDQTFGTPRIRPGEAGEICIVGTAPGADAAIWPENVPVAILGDITTASTLGDTGTLPLALRAIWAQYERTSGKIAVIRVPDVADPAAQISAVVGSPVDMTGVHAARKVQDALDFVPDILIAPGFAFAQAGGPANPAIKEMVTVAERIRAYVFADGPNTTTADAIQARDDYSSDRLSLIDPMMTMWSTTANAHVEVPGSAVYAGVQSRLDLEKGFWWSPDNKEVRGVTGIARPVDWRLNDSGCEATQMTRSAVSTFYRDKGFWTWGGGSVDPLRTLGGTVVGRRVADKVYDALEQGLRAYIGVPVSIQAIRDIAGLVENFLRELVQKGAIIGATFEMPEDLNTPRQIADGILFFRLKFVEAAPIRDIEIWGYRTPDLYEEFLERAAAASAFSLVARD